MNLKYDKLGLKLALATAFMSGFSVFINKYGVSIADPSVYTTAKNMVAAALLAGVLLVGRDYSKVGRVTRWQWAGLLAVGLVGGCVPFILYFKGLALTSAAHAAFIHKTMFVFVAVGAVFLLGERLTFGVVFAGVLLLLGSAFLAGFSPSGVEFGDVLVAAATLFWAAENLLSRRLLSSVPSGVLACARMVFGSVFLLVYLALTGQLGGLLSLSAAAWEWSFVTGVLLFLYVGCWYVSLSRLPAGVATAILLLGAPITALLSFLFAGSSLTFTQAAGLVLVPAGLLFWVFEAEFRTTLGRAPSGVKS
ncbi:EamA-like transporter family protein [uncultured archaeon]|nr:EamA-like transporter family protein [uncultured archaeon]